MEKIKCKCAFSRPIPKDHKCKVCPAQISLRKLVVLMEEQVTAKFYARQVVILNDFLTACPYAFSMPDLVYVIKLIHMVIDRSKICNIFEAPLSRLLSLCYHPPLLKLSSDVLTYRQDLQEYFSFLAYLLLRMQDTIYQKWLLECLNNQLTKKYSIPNSIKLKYRLEAIENSKLPEILSDLIKIDSQNYLEVTLALIEQSNVANCKIIVRNVLGNLLEQLDESRLKEDDSPFKPNQNIGLISKLIWNLLYKCEKLPEEIVKKINPPTLNAIWTLRLALQFTIKQQNLHTIRNTLAAIAFFCIKLFPKLNIASTGLIDDISFLSISTEIKPELTWADRIDFTTNDSDYDFKKICLFIIYFSAKNKEYLPMIQSRKVIKGLLKLITPNHNHSWHPELYKKLVLISLNILEILAPLLSKDFVLNNGVLRMMILIEYYLIEPYDMEVLKISLKSLSIIANSNNETILKTFGIEPTVHILITLCKNLLNNHHLNETVQHSLSSAFNLLEVLCGTFTVTDKNILQLCMKVIDRLIHPNIKDSRLDKKLITSSLTFIWEGIVHMKKNLIPFIKNEGTYRLLELIQSTDFCGKVLALGILVDLCQEDTCITEIIAWRNNGRNIVELLLELFREETESPGKALCKKTCIECKCVQCANNNAIIELFGSCKPKIYAIFKLLNSSHKETPNCCYSCCTQDLNINDQITLITVHNFLRIKYGQVWNDLSIELDNLGIEPLEIDKEIIDKYVNGFNQWIRYLKNSQEQLLIKEKNRILKEEKSLFRTIKECRIAPTLDAMHIADYIYRTTEMLYRILRKMQLNIDRNSSLQEIQVGTCTHLTFFEKITVTPVFNQIISVQSDIVENQANDIKNAIFDNIVQTGTSQGTF